MATAEEIKLLEKLEADREVFSMDFHQAQKEFQEVLAKEPEDIGLIRDALEVFQDEVDEYFQFDVRYQNAYYDVHGNCEEYQLVVLLAKKQLREAKMLLNKTRRRIAVEEDDKQTFVSGSQGGGGGQNRRRLPKLNLPTFSGDIKDWLTFWSQFEDIHNDPTIPSVDKFQYLLQAMTPGTVAHEIVKGFALTAKNYDAAVRGLMERYNRESALVKVYILDLLDLVTSNRNQEAISLSSLYVQLSSKLRALETLGVTTEKCAFVVYPLVECCLPKDILTVWHRDPSNKDEDDCTKQLENLMSFLKKEVNGEDNMRMTGGGALGCSKEQKRDRVVKLDRGNGKPTTAADLLSTTTDKQGKKPCVFCGGAHPTEACGKACKMTVDERKKCLRDSRSCFTCLKIGHDSRQCRGNPLCLNCGGKHETVMCYKLASQQRSQDDSTSHQSSTENTNEDKVAEMSCDMTNFTSDGNVVFLKTLLVLVQGKNQVPIQVRAIIDDASNKSYILKSLAKKLKLTPVKKEAVIHYLYTGQQTEVTQHTVYTVTISDMEGNYRREVKLSDSDCISSTINCYRNGPWVDELDQRGVTLSDLNTIDGPADILLGANLAGSLITGNIIQLECGAVAVETKLGWTLLEETDLPVQCRRSNYHTSMLSIPVSIDMNMLHMTGDNVDKLWRLDTLGITDSIEKKAKAEQDEETMQRFFDSTKKVGWRFNFPGLTTREEVFQVTGG